MKEKTLTYKLGIVFTIVVGFMLSSRAKAQVSVDEFDVDEVIKAIKSEIQTAQATETGLPRLKIDRVELELAVTTEQEITGGIKVKVVRFGAEVNKGATKGTTHTLNLVLSSLGPYVIERGSNFGLVPAIQSVKVALRNALNEPPRFKLETFTFELETAIERKAGGGLTFLVVDLPNLKSKNLATHKIKLHISLAE
jgi:hypothetical protein